MCCAGCGAALTLCCRVHGRTWGFPLSFPAAERHLALVFLLRTLPATQPLLLDEVFASCVGRACPGALKIMGVL